MTRYFIVSPTRNGNALGRALSMALVARELGPTEVLAHDDGPLWRPASQFDIAVGTLAPAASFLSSLRRFGNSGDGRAVVWLAKGFAPLPDYAQVCAGSDAVELWLDQDDDDVGLARAFRASSPTNFLRTIPPRRMAPGVLARQIARSRAAASLVTVSSDALARQLGLDHGDVPLCRVPHTRIPAAARAASAEAGGTIRLAFLGTVRPHKGLGVLVEILRSDPAVELTTFAQRSISVPPELSARWHQLDPETPLATAYAGIDAVLLPMDDRPGSDVQLPAKMIDAMNHGVAICATPTSAIAEYLDDSRYLPIDDWSDAAGTIRTIRAAPLRELAASAHAYFTAHLTPSAIAAELARAVPVGA